MNCNTDLNELLAKLDVKDLDKDKKFVTNSLKGQIVEDIINAMEEENLSRSDLARKLSKSRQYISRIINETANFTLETLVEIAIALNRNISFRIIKNELGKNYLPNSYKEGEHCIKYTQSKCDTIAA